MATAQDIPLLIVSENSASERRISPSWTIAQLKGRLEPVTGVPATCQRLSLKIGSQPAQPIEAADEESTILAAWPLQAYAELKVGITDLFFFSSLVAFSVLQYVARYIRVRGGDITSHRTIVVAIICHVEGITATALIYSLTLVNIDGRIACFSLDFHHIRTNHYHRNITSMLTNHPTTDRRYPPSGRPPELHRHLGRGEIQHDDRRLRVPHRQRAGLEESAETRPLRSQRA
jgi:hypothetical protein